MKIPVGHGSYLEPDEGPRNTKFHKRIVKTERIPQTRTGNWTTLECGHRHMTFGDLSHADGVILCTSCRDREVGS